MSAHRKDFTAAVEHYASGEPIGEVAARFGMTRQSMWKILQRRGVAFRSRISNGPDNPFFVDGVGLTRLKERARSVLSNEISKGRLVAQPCEACGFEGRAIDGRNLVHGHHDDYTRPLEVRWLCQSCHFDEHH